MMVAVVQCPMVHWPLNISNPRLPSKNLPSVPCPEFLFRLLFRTNEDEVGHVIRGVPERMRHQHQREKQGETDKKTLTSILMSLRAYYNYLLFRLGVRKVLPAMFINRLPVQECGEKLVSCQGKYIRKTVCEMLAKAECLLPNGYTIKLLDGYRSKKEQLRRRAQFFKQLDAEHPEWTADERERYVNRSIAKKSGHNTGGAVDVTLAHEGKELDCGTAYLEFTPLTRTDAKGLTDIQQKNREMLFQVMTAAGFVNYPLEWWHYCYGDKMYAAYKCLPLAQYGSIERSMKNDDIHD